MLRNYPKSMSARFLFPREPLAINEPELGHFDGNVPKEGIPQGRKFSRNCLWWGKEGGAGFLKKKEGNSLRQGIPVPGEQGSPEIRELKKGMHNLGCYISTASEMKNPQTIIGGTSAA